MIHDMAGVGQQDPLVAVYKERMRRTDLRRAALTTLFAGCTALVIVLYIFRPGTGPDGPPLRITVVALVIALIFASGACSTCRRTSPSSGGTRCSHC